MESVENCIQGDPAWLRFKAGHIFDEKKICASSSPPLSNPAPASLFLPLSSSTTRPRTPPASRTWCRPTCATRGCWRMPCRTSRPRGPPTTGKASSWPSSSSHRWDIVAGGGCWMVCLPSVFEWLCRDASWKYRQQPGGLMKSCEIHLTAWYNLSSSNLSILFNYENKDGAQDNLMPRAQWCYSEE